MAARLVAGQQKVPELSLSAPADQLAESFTRIVAVRELANGTVLLGHRYHPTPLLGDFATGRTSEVGRTGAGPGEYREIRGIFPLAGDSSLVDDPQTPRWSILSGTTFVRSHATWGVGWYGPRLVGADRFGGVLEVRPTAYGRQRGIRVNEIPANAESLAVIRHVRASAGAGGAVERSDTLARIRGAFRGVARLMRTLGKEEGRGIGTWFELRAILASDDQAILFPDGWVAIAFQEPYHVRWRSPDGAWRTGPPLPFVRVPVDELQRTAAIRRDWPRSPRLFSPSDYPYWPRFLPPFLDDALVAMPDGRLAIRRTPDARTSRTEYDVIDRDGRLTGRLVLKGSEHVAAFGARWIYVVTRDADDLDWLRRHPQPLRP